MKKMYLKSIFTILTLVVLLGYNTKINAQDKVITVEEFDKVLISPHIQVTFKEGKKESIYIQENKERKGILNIKVKNKKLHLYLEGAKISSPTKKMKVNGYFQKVPIYKGTIVKAVITYKKVSDFSFRGEQRFVFKSDLIQKECNFNIKGESEVIINSVELERLKLAIYGESFINIKKGIVKKQKITAYGASKVVANEIKSNEVKITAYGDGTYQLSASEKIKVTSYGEATITYKGKAKLKKGIIIGESTIENIN